MISGIIVFIISFILDGLLSNIINQNSLFLPLCTIITIPLIYPYFKKNKLNDYYKLVIIFGALYDMVYTNTIFVNITIFFILAQITILFNKSLSDNIINFSFLMIISITSYRIITYFNYLLMSKKAFSFITLIAGIYKSYLFNLIYGSILYIILEKVSFKYKIYRR